MLGYLENHLKWMKEDYDKRVEYFKIEVEKMDKSDANFERNAINSLTVMMDLKSRISELEKTIDIVKVYEKEE